MKKTNIALLALALLSQYSMAECTLDKTRPDGGGDPTTLSIPGATIVIDADSPESDTKPIATYSSSTGNLVSFINCDSSAFYGKNVLPPLLEASAANRTFTTKIDGFEVKPLWNNGVASGRFPSRAAVGAASVRFNYPTSSYFILEIYKTKRTIKLTKPSGDILLDGGIIAYNWIGTESPDKYGQRLQIGEISIISTPVCSLDGEKTVDFNTVSATNIANGVKRPLNFSLTCATDYGSYSASAALSTQTPTSDNAYIQVKDQANNTDRLKIRVDSSTGTALTVDGKTNEVKSSINGVATQFSWSATLLRDSLVNLPASGPFTATAEIILLVN